jgi:2,3-bisphosphoglycerate-independent phosphoglycerate mutase
MDGPLVLVICDGIGINKKKQGNAFAMAKKPNFNRLLKRYPTAVLKPSEEGVGLPKGYQGNSEVGHLTIGSGRKLLQELLRINQSINNKSFFKNKGVIRAINHAKKHKRALHIMGLLQDQGVHAHIGHLFAILKLAKEKNIKDVYIHVFTDGRDTPSKSAKTYLNQLETYLRKEGIGKIATIVGRYYAMDRDKRWTRTEIAYRAINNAEGKRFESWKDALKDAYACGESDEFIRPRIIGEYKGLMDNDAVIFYNFRYDRARQLTKALVEPNFKDFHRRLKKIFFTAFTEYYRELKSLNNVAIAFPQEKIKNLLGEILSKNRIKQLRISETEKYAHVTFFFNGLREKPFRYEERILIPSPKVPTYDLKPEMSVYEVTDKLIENIDNYKVIITNLVNGDMVGHTGNLRSAIKAVEAVDYNIGRIVEATLKRGGTVLITADHGNCEEMYGVHKTSHTLNNVFLIFVSNKMFKINRKKGFLYDIAPTILKILGIKKPSEMGGKSFV